MSPIKPQNCVCDVIKYDVIKFLIVYNINNSNNNNDNNNNSNNNNNNNNNNELYLTREHIQQSVLPDVPDTNIYNTKSNVQYTQININTNNEYIKTIE